MKHDEIDQYVDSFKEPWPEKAPPIDYWKMEAQVTETPIGTRLKWLVVLVVSLIIIITTRF